MSTTALGTYVTPEQYLAWERDAPTKSEYFDGTIQPMPGARRPHILIAGNLHRIVGTHLVGRPGEVYQNDMRVRVGPANLYVYPDVVAVADAPRFEDDESDVLLNPTMIAEVLSPSTEAIDRGRKLEAYRQLPSLELCLLISQDRVRVESFERRGEEWSASVLIALDEVLRLAPVGCDVALRDLYDKIAFVDGP